MKLGRNNICHCGSGQKYKHCHLESEKTSYFDGESKAYSGITILPEDKPRRFFTKNMRKKLRRANVL